jgi:tetratricopeptide (TPR) repeat protein
MKRIKSIALMMMISMAISSFAQTLDEAGTAFNQAIQFTKDLNYAEALKSYEQTIKICTQLGDAGMDLQLKAEQQLPGTYFNLAKGLFDAKNYTEAIPNFEKSAQYADQMGEIKTGDASRTYLAAIYTSLGNADYKSEDLDQAIEKFNKALSYKPGYYKAYYGLGVVYKKQENLPLMKEALDKVIAMAEDDVKTIGNAKDAAASAFQKAGAVALQANKYSVAAENLTGSLEYNNTEPRTYFYLAIAYNGLSKWDDAITAANRALELQTEDKSDIYFELGKSSEGKGDVTAACDYYKKVIAGNNIPAAKYQMEQVLKCK